MLVALAMGVALAALAPSSASATTPHFKARYTVLDTQLVYLGTQVGYAVNHASTASDDQLAYGFALFAIYLKQLQVKADRLHPSSRLAGRYRAFLGSLAPVIRDLRTISRAAERGDASAAGRATKSLVTDSEALHASRLAVRRGL